MKSNSAEIVIVKRHGSRRPESPRPEDIFPIEETKNDKDASLDIIFENINSVIVRLDKYGRITRGAKHRASEKIPKRTS